MISIKKCMDETERKGRQDERVDWEEQDETGRIGQKQTIGTNVTKWDEKKGQNGMKKKEVKWGK